MHLAVPGAVAHLYHTQRVLTQGGEYMAWLSEDFHLGNQQLERSSGADGRLTYAPSGDFPSRTYPPRILRRLWHWGRRSMAESVLIGN